MIMVGTVEAVKQLLNAEGSLVKADYPPSVHKVGGLPANSQFGSHLV